MLVLLTKVRKRILLLICLKTFAALRFAVSLETIRPTSYYRYSLAVNALFCALCVTSRPAERGGRKDHCPGARGAELSGLECKIHQLKLRSADAIMFFFNSGRNLNICGRYDLILLITRC